MSSAPGTEEQIATGVKRQTATAIARAQAGSPSAGWKVAFNDPAAQKRIGVSGPMAGRLDGAMLLQSGAAIAPPQGSRLHLEVELAVSLRHSVPASATRDDAAAAIDWIAPAFEVIDLNIPGQPLEELVANSFFQFATVLGPTRPYDPGILAGFSPRLLEGDSVIRETVPGRVPADLAEVVAFAAGWLGAHGLSLDAGQIIICGTFIDPAPAEPGKRYLADCGPAGAVELTISA